jgi:ABC-type transporter Mla maintaining outer membrane lipid asymmetry ATPase subunit MlaF
MIEVKNLYKSFEDREVLRNINTVFEDGKTNLIIGQSGSGKTVLMKNLVGLLEPTSGQVLYDGRDFVQMSKREKVLMRREMGMIFQSAALFDSMTVLENVMFPLDMFSSMTLRERIHQPGLADLPRAHQDQRLALPPVVPFDDLPKDVPFHVRLLSRGSLAQVFHMFNRKM